MRWKEIGIALVTVLVFILSSAISRSYEGALTSLFEGRGAEGLVLYFLFILVSFVIAPIGGIATYPVVVVIWGPLTASAVTMVGWTLGTVLNYFLSRTYGRSLVGKFVSAANIEKFSRALPQSSFLNLVIAHAVFPGDILGYVLGLAIRVPYWKFGLAAIIGNAPYLVLLTLAASASFIWQVVMGIFSLLLIFLVGKNVIAKLTEQ